jgi:hypothetical protein
MLPVTSASSDMQHSRVTDDFRVKILARAREFSLLEIV